VFLFVCLCPVSGVPNVDSISVLCFCLFVSKQKHNTEILSTLGTPDTGQRQTNKNTIQRYCSISVLCFCFFVFVLCLVYPMLTYLCVVFFVCLSSKTKHNTTQRYCQHWVHQTQDKDKQTKTQYLCLVYPMLSVCLCCVFCLFVFVLCLVYPMLTVSHQTQDRDKQTKTQHRDTVNIGYTRHRTETNKQKHNTEILCLFDSSLPQLFVGGLMSYLRYLCLFGSSLPQLFVGGPMSYLRYLCLFGSSKQLR
jgi:uncharacterized membrane protein